MFKRIRRWLKYVGDVFYWIRTHTYNAYHHTHFDIRGEDDYKWGWIDRDHAMMLVCFKLLCDYVEEESSQVGWDWNENIKEVKKEIDYLYNWWKTERPTKKQLLENFCNIGPKCEIRTKPVEGNPCLLEMLPLNEKESKHIKIFKEMEEALEKEEDDNLIRLMKIRRYLWS